MVSSDEESDASSGSDNEEKQMEERAATLEQEISNNKYLYEVHIELVDLYRQLTDYDSLRAAYKRFAEYYPLTQTIWLDWLKDEIKIESDKTYVLSLFEKAVEDYLSIPVWLEYIQYSLGNCEMEETYRIIEKAISAGGLHVTKGSLLWDSLRELELAHLQQHEPVSEVWKQHAQKVFDVFKRQLSVPLFNMENTYDEFQQWMEQLPEGYNVDSKLIEWGYQKALKVLDKFKPFEDQLMSDDCEDTALIVYRDYIKAVSDPPTCLCLYERAVAHWSLNATLWSDYCLFSLKLGQVAESVSKRSVRNCPWDENLWVLRLRTLEHQSYSDKEVMDCLEQALTSVSPTPGLNLWLSYLEFMRRSLNTVEHINKVFGQAVEHLGEVGDPAFKVLRLQARLSARNGDIAQARRIWSQIMRNLTHKGSASAWIEYATLEKQFGDAHHLRLLYERAINVCTDWPHYIADDWLMYEKECGSLQDVLKCEDKCKKVVAINIETPGAESPPQGKKRSYENGEKNAVVKRMKTVGISTPPPSHTKHDVTPKIDSQKSVFVSNMREDIREPALKKLFPNAVNISIPMDRKGKSRCYAYIQFSSIEEVENALNRDREPIDGRPLYISKCVNEQSERGKFKYSTKGENNKLFVRGLPLSFTQTDVENLFRLHGAVAVRLVVRKNGRSKGLAYVEFPDSDKAHAALKAVDQLTVKGHTITVAISAPPLKNTSPDILEPRRHARSRLQLPLVPRSVQVKKIDDNVNTSSKSNEDFRKMLFNK